MKVRMLAMLASWDRRLLVQGAQSSWGRGCMVFFGRWGEVLLVRSCFLCLVVLQILDIQEDAFDPGVGLIPTYEVCILSNSIL